MAKNSDTSFVSQNAFGRFIISAIVGAGVFIISLIVLVFIFSMVQGGNVVLEKENFTVWNYVFVILSSLISGFVSGKMFGKKGIYTGFVTGLFNCFFMYLLTTIINHSKGLSGAAFIMFTVVVLMSIIGSILGVNKSKN